jgi:hypothetical protein
LLIGEHFTPTGKLVQEKLGSDAEMGLLHRCHWPPVNQVLSPEFQTKAVSGER